MLAGFLAVLVVAFRPGVCAAWLDDFVAGLLGSPFLGCAGVGDEAAGAGDGFVFEVQFVAVFRAALVWRAPVDVAH